MIPLKLSILLVLLKSAHCDDTLVDFAHSKTKIWGPGLNPNSQLPTSYVFVELYTHDGERLEKSAGSPKVKLTPGTDVMFRGRVEVIDRKDGSYIIHFRPVVPMFNLTLSIELNGAPLADSPYVIPGWIYQENCNCPNMDTQEWLDALECPKSFEQVDEDLGPFANINMREVEREVYRRWPRRPGEGAAMHYVIKNNRVYRKEVGTICGFKIFADAIFLSLARKVVLPDIEFFFNLGDWPIVHKGRSAHTIPVFGWCGSDSTHDIVLPTYDLAEATMKALSQVAIDIITVQGNPGCPAWPDKIPKALFRGRDSRQERLDLAKLSLRGNNSQYIDAAITAFFFFRKDEELLGDRMNFYDFFKYKYQLNIDGTVAAYRLPYLMAADSLVLKQDSKYYEHFYRHLLPWSHYIPLKSDLSDVIEQVKWAQDHDEQAQRIAATGREWTRDNLTPASIYCYYYSAIQKFASRIISKIDVAEGMEEAEHSTYFSDCTCHRPSGQRRGSKQRASDEL